MVDVVIKQEPEVKKEATEEDIKETLKSADEYAKLKEENDKLEAEYQRRQELKAKIDLAGRANAGILQKEETQDDIDQKEADKMLDMFK